MDINVTDLCKIASTDAPTGIVLYKETDIPKIQIVSDLSPSRIGCEVESMIISCMAARAYAMNGERVPNPIYKDIANFKKKYGVDTINTANGYAEMMIYGKVSSVEPQFKMTYTVKTDLLKGICDVLIEYKHVMEIKHTGGDGDGRAQLFVYASMLVLSKYKIKYLTLCNAKLGKSTVYKVTKSFTYDVALEYITNLISLWKNK